VDEVVTASSGPLWIAYAVATDGPHSMCCWDSTESVGRACCPGCRLEGKGPFTIEGGDSVSLEDDRQAVVLLRAESRRISRVRTFSWSCALDAGGLPVVWLTGVRAADSVRLLSSLLTGAEGSGRDRLDGALMALSVHAEPAAVDALIDAARRGASSHLRAQALFWLSQKAGQRATAAIARAVDEDPESQVRERAVFALSQLPKDEAVPRLIALARSHRDPNVRKRAMFWLGQTEDPRAVAFFEEVLRR
jgi:HEAT repeat protein